MTLNKIRLVKNIDNDKTYQTIGRYILLLHDKQMVGIYDVDQSKQISIHFKRKSPQNVCYLMQGINNTRYISFDAFVAWFVEIFSRCVFDFSIRDVLLRVFRNLFSEKWVCCEIKTTKQAVLFAFLLILLKSLLKHGFDKKNKV